MYEYEELSAPVDEIIIKDKPSFFKSKNETYYNMKEDEKKTRASFLSI